jgi:hypothetical protein
MNTSVMNPMDPREMNNNTSSNDKLKILIDEVKNLRRINAEQKQELDEVENGSSKKMKIGLLGIMIMLGMLGALSIHEAAKYFINRSMKFNGGTSNLYIMYPVGVICLVAIIFYKSLQQLN